jgi:hypothetical protein
VDQRIRIQIKGKDAFWGRAFHVEWEHQYPDRLLVSDSLNFFMAPAEWLPDLERVGTETLCKVVQAPENPRRREWMGALMPWRSS